MPIDRLVLIVVLVIAAAAATVAGALMLIGRLDIDSMLGIAGLSVIALCASFALRKFTDRKRDDI
ncbi:hypothetical protein MWU60_03530 [Yoonia sp. F2084L]|uniref:hypothetical protein n=1 Tax=Yoonia sp. F2084L TaxID=2926419 RepID=UPI001FF4241F|nr:hypothetical protein [Yoonia sp. F2084L]MCK0094629.1 hypothetical protein [Yoonia sp. F2084L]